MKLAIVSVSAKGSKLGVALKAGLPAETALFSLRRADLPAGACPFDKLSELVAQIFSGYDGLVFIMAAGIAVRVLAPHIRDKRHDPAVVVMDDAGIHAVSLLSGHIGGANELARQVAAIVGARPVITTATDVAGLPAPDEMAARLGLKLEPFEQVKKVNAAIAGGQKVPFVLDRQLPGCEAYLDWAAKAGLALCELPSLQGQADFDAAVIISDKVFPLSRLHVYLRPATLAVGIGCRKGASSGEILGAVQAACARIGRSPCSIAVVGSSIVKQSEPGLLAAVAELAVPVYFYDNQQVQAVIDKQGLATSPFVAGKIGVGNICEATALLGAGNSSLLLGKTVYPKVTVAIAAVSSPWWESARATAEV